MEMNTEHEFAEPADPIPPDAPRRNSRRLVLLASFALTLVLAAGSFGFFLGHANQISTNAFTNPGATNPRFPSGGYGSYGYYGGYPNATTTPAGNTPSSQANAAAAKIAASVDPGLVDIATTLSYQQGSAAGTGMIVSSNGLVLTNNHVIAGATSISVRDVATAKVYQATVMGYDVSSDVAVLQLKNASGLTTITTNTGAATLGESVVASATLVALAERRVTPPARSWPSPS